MISTVPVGLRLDGRKTLVVGAGRIAARKARALTDQGALVHVVAPDHAQEMADVPVACRSYRDFTEADLDGVWFVVTATGDPVVDGQVYRAATRLRVWCNSADDPENCSVILPAVVRREDITISISTGGTSPASASWLRRRIEGMLDDGALSVVTAAASVRRRVRAAGLKTEVPGWSEILDQQALSLSQTGDVGDLQQRLLEAVAPELATAS